MQVHASSAGGVVTRRPKVWLGLSLFAVVSLAATPARASDSDPDLFMPLVEGVHQINGGGFPSGVFAEAAEWRTIATGDEDTGPLPTNFVLAREYGRGRVLAIGHESMLSTANLQILDNARFMKNVVRWLDSAQSHQVLYTTGHDEGGEPNQQGLRALFIGESYTFTAVPGTITPSALLPGSVLVVGQAKSDFTPGEIEAIRQFVADGGGLLLAAQGWSWGRPLDEFPMNRLGAPFQVRWLGSNLSDPTNNIGDAVIFHVLYPDPRAELQSLSGAMRILEQAHAAHPVDLMAALELDANLRYLVVAAHSFLAAIRRLVPPEHPSRAAVYDFYLGLMRAFPEQYARLEPIDRGQYATSVWLRERVWRTLRDALPLTPERQTEIAAAGRLTGRYADIWYGFGLILLDNLRLNAAQLEFLYRYLSLVPKELHNLRAISVGDFLGPLPTGLAADGEPGAVNIFGVPIGGYRENSFPIDVSPGIVDGFSVVVAHEVNHVVDVHWVYGSADLTARRNQLIQQAGTDPANYLRGGSVGFFFHNPQEFLASIANQWFTDSAKTIELGIRRFEVGRLDPINQALFFADVYSRGGNTTFFYTTDVYGNITRTTMPLTRDAAGRITSLEINSDTYVFTLNDVGDVVAIAIAEEPPALERLGDAIEALSNTAVKARGHRTAMLSILADVRALIDSGDTTAALRTLENMRRKVDGCDGSATATPDRNDWITDCEQQNLVRALIDELLESE